MGVKYLSPASMHRCIPFTTITLVSGSLLKLEWKSSKVVQCGEPLPFHYETLDVLVKPLRCTTAGAAEDQRRSGEIRRRGLVYRKHQFFAQPDPQQEQFPTNCRVPKTWCLTRHVVARLGAKCAKDREERFAITIGDRTRVKCF